MKQLKSAIQIVAITLGIMFGTLQKSEAAAFYDNYYNNYSYYYNLYYYYGYDYNTYVLGQAYPYLYWYYGGYSGDYYGYYYDAPGAKSSNYAGWQTYWSSQKDYYAYVGDYYWATY